MPWLVVKKSLLSLVWDQNFPNLYKSLQIFGEFVIDMGLTSRLQRHVPTQIKLKLPPPPSTVIYCDRCISSKVPSKVFPRILDILQDKTLFCAFEASDIVCWLVNQPIAKLDLFKSPDCRWIGKTYAEYCCRSSATVRRLVQSPTLQSTIFCGVHSDLRGKGIRVSPAWYSQLSVATAVLHYMRPT